MSTTEQPSELAAPLDPLPVYLDARAAFAASYLIGEGLEIGPLHQPLPVPPHARVRYVDRMSAAELRREYPELAEWDLAEVDIIDDGETLASIEPESQDFIVANHFLEHTENPIGTIEAHLGRLKPGGVLFYAVPDKRFTFDFRRPATPIEHMVEDYELGADRSRAEHYREWCRLVIAEAEHSGATAEETSLEEWVELRARQLEDANYSIHMHVWTQAEFLQLVLALRERFEEEFDVEAAARGSNELIVVLRKQGPLPGPPVPEQPPSPSRPRPWKGRARHILSRARKALRPGRTRP